MKIGLVCEFATLNGGEQSLLAALDELQRRSEAGWEFVGLLPAGPLFDCWQQRGWPVELAHWRNADGVRCSTAELDEQLTRFAQRQRVDLLHGNSLSTGRWLGRWCQTPKHWRVPCTAHLRDMLRLSTNAIHELNRVNQLVAVSQATADYHAAQGLDVSRVRVIHNGVDLLRWSPQPATGHYHRALGLPHDAVLVGTLGQLGLRKGHDVLLAAWPEIRRQWPTAHLLIGGERHSGKAESLAYVEQLHQRANEPDCLGSVHWLGWVDDVPAWLAELVMLVHPARQEPLGRVLLEALACCRCIVATDVGGTREVLGDPPIGRLIPPDHPPAITQAVLELFSNEPGRRAIEQAARARASALFPIQRAAEGLAEVWREQSQLRR